MIVLDASAFLEVLLRTRLGISVQQHIESDSSATPHLFDAEVLHRLVKFGKHGVLLPDEVGTRVEILREAPITRIDHRPLLSRARELSHALSGYDALYAALADLAGAQLVTGDRAFARTAVNQLQLDVAAL